MQGCRGAWRVEVSRAGGRKPGTGVASLAWQAKQVRMLWPVRCYQAVCHTQLVCLGLCLGLCPTPAPLRPTPALCSPSLQTAHSRSERSGLQEVRLPKEHAQRCISHGARNQLSQPYARPCMQARPAMALDVPAHTHLSPMRHSGPLSLLLCSWQAGREPWVQWAAQAGGKAVAKAAEQAEVSCLQNTHKMVQRGRLGCR